MVACSWLDPNMTLMARQASPTRNDTRKHLFSGWLHLLLPWKDGGLRGPVCDVRKQGKQASKQLVSHLARATLAHKAPCRDAPVGHITVRRLLQEDGGVTGAGHEDGGENS